MADEKVMPHSVEAERALLGALIRDSRWLDLIDLDAKDFYRPDHGNLYALMRGLHADGHAVDSVTVLERVAKGGRADRYGGIPYVVELPDGVPATANAEHYAGMIRDRARRRRHITKLGMLTEGAYDLHRPIEEIEDGGLASLLNVDGGAGTATWASIGDVSADEIHALDEAKAQGGRPMLSTGFRELDDAIGGGLQAPDLMIIAGRPAMGKSLAAMQIAKHVAMKSGQSVGVFSLEMGRGQLAQRLLADMGNVAASRLRRGSLDDDERGRAVLAQHRLARSRMFVDDTSDLGIDDVRVRCRRLAAQCEHTGKLGLVVIDYLQLMEGDPKLPREQQVAKISKGLKSLAKELQIPVIALAQLSRVVEERKDRRPILSDLRESGAVEQDADLVLFPFRPEVYFPDTPNVPAGFCEVIIAKNRNGATGSADLIFDGQYQRLTDATIDQKMRYRAPKGAWPPKPPAAPRTPTSRPPRGKGGAPPAGGIQPADVHDQE